MLINCPECELQISDQAITCPHCGYPLKPNKLSSLTAKKRNKLPNRFGQITKIKGSLTNKYRVMVNLGRKPNGKYNLMILKPKGYFRTYNEAYKALVEYNMSPYELAKQYSMDEVFYMWTEENDKKVTSKNIKNSKLYWEYISSIHNLKIQETKISHLKNALTNAFILRKGEKIKASPTVLIKIKQILNMMYDFAVSNEYVNENIARKFELDPLVTKKLKENRTSHITFTDSEINILWENKQDRIVKMILICCYSGIRGGELVSIKHEDINFENMTIIGGSKTNAGKNRIIPIHDKIIDLVKDLYTSTKGKSKYICGWNGTDVGFRFSNYNYNFKNKLEELGLSSLHKTHDCRKTFITKAKKYNLDEYAIKRIVGHAINDITEEVYTERTAEWLRSEINKITV